MALRTKTPPEKKRLSLLKDRRNTYGENDKSSRKNIPKSKALSHRKVRRKASEFERTWDQGEETAAEARELTLVTPRLQKGAFKKSSDMPLGQLLKSRTKRRPKSAH